MVQNDTDREISSFAPSVFAIVHCLEMGWAVDWSICAVCCTVSGAGAGAGACCSLELVCGPLVLVRSYVAWPTTPAPGAERRARKKDDDDDDDVNYAQGGAEGVNGGRWRKRADRRARGSYEV